jgi:hypothetical protein
MRYGAAWPWVEQEGPRLFQNTSSLKACRVGGFNKAISLGYFSLGQQREVTRAPAGARKPAAGEPSSDSANVSESLPQASQPAITPVHPPTRPTPGASPPQKNLATVNTTNHSPKNTKQADETNRSKKTSQLNRD